MNRKDDKICNNKKLFTSIGNNFDALCIEYNTAH